MCIRTGIRDVYQGVQGACPRRAVTPAEGTAERRAVGAGLRLVRYDPIITLDLGDVTRDGSDLESGRPVQHCSLISQLMLSVLSNKSPHTITYTFSSAV